MKSVSWEEYAEVYDLMAENNPAYQDLMSRYRLFLESRSRPVRKILDAGAGTGNFSLLAAQMFPEAEVIHLEPDEGMNRRLVAKSDGIRNLSIVTLPVECAEFPAECFDLIISVHALYTMPEPHKQLERMAGWLRPGGSAFLCDFGRLMDLADWRNYLFRHFYREKGLLRAVQLLWQGRNVACQNSRIAAIQREGRYWMHSPKDFRAAVTQAGFQVAHQEEVYRGASDLILTEVK